MRLYKDENNKLYAYEADGSQDEYIGKNLTRITDEEAEQIRIDNSPPPVIPSIVSMRQARLALLKFGLLSAVSNVIAQGSEADKITWEFSTEIARDFPLVQNMKVPLGLSEEDLDSLFILASTL